MSTSPPPLASPGAGLPPVVLASRQPLVSIIAPVYNEEAVIEAFLTRVIAAIASLKARYDFEIVLVDDGSRDRSLAIMKRFSRFDKRLRVIEMRRNFGQTPALQAGLDAARGDIFITMDSDLQHFPEEIPAFLAKLEEGYDCVCGWRHQRQEGAIRRWPSRAANYLLRRISGLPLHDFGTTYRSYRAEIARNLRLFGEHHRFVPVLCHLEGAKITEMPIKNIERPQGKSNYGLSRTFGVFFDLFLLFFLVSYLDRPLRAFGKIALACFGTGSAILAVLALAAYWLGYSTFREHSGWFTLGVMLILTSVHILLAGILAELLIRVHFSLGDRRVYHVRQEWNSENLDL